MSDGLLVIAHGSRDHDAVGESLELVRLMAGRRGGAETEVAFLEFAGPTIEESLASLAARGIRRVVCQPAMLLGAGHVKRDIPEKLQVAARAWPSLEIHMGGALRLHPKLLELCRLRLSQAMTCRPPCSAGATMLLFVGRGCSEPEANEEVARIGRILQGEYRFGGAAACYSGNASPLLPEALEHAARGGFHRIIVQPYLLFSGVLLKKIQTWTVQAAGAHTDLDIFCTAHLGAHPLVADVLEERAAESLRIPALGTPPVQPNRLDNRQPHRHVSVDSLRPSQAFTFGES